MRTIIYIMVYAKDSESALDAAHKVVGEKLRYTDQGGAFYCYEDFTESSRKKPDIVATEETLVSALKNNDCSDLARFGKTDWEPLPSVLQVSNARSS